MTNYDKFHSSDIEDFIKSPVSFSLNDDFFDEEKPSKERYKNLYDHIEPLVQPKKNIPPQPKAQESSPTAEKPRKTRETKKNNKYSVFSDLLGKFRYEPAPEENVSSKMAYEAFREDEPEKAEPEKKTRTDIFGEERIDEDLLYNYDVNRLFDIQREISTLINAIQRLQSSETRLSKKEEELRERAEKMMRENSAKKEHIDKLFDDINSLYEVIKARSALLEEREDELLAEPKTPVLTYSPYLPESSSSKREPKWAEKPPVINSAKESPKSFSEASKEKAAKESFEINDVPTFGLDKMSISAINSAINSMK
ncbi:MAG: hypothetical protein IKM61_09215 [Eubacteriaceae bacterium]|nr:hypothetical protein [Eubacteriaceae bacterium]